MGANTTKQEREDLLRRVAREESERIESENAKRKREIRECYRQHAPKQIAQAGKMMAAGKLCLRIRQSETDYATWESLGKSDGGGRRGTLYRCLKTS